MGQLGVPIIVVISDDGNIYESIVHVEETWFGRTDCHAGQSNDVSQNMSTSL